MATNIPPVFPPAREAREQQVHYVRRSVTFASGAFVMPASIPAGALIVSAVILIETAFSNGATLVLGTAPGADDLVAAAGSAATAAGVKRPDTATLKGRLAVDTPVYGTVTGTPTVGAATIVLHFVPDNDG